MADFEFWMTYGADGGQIPIDLYGKDILLKNALNELKRACSIIENAGRVVIGKYESLPKKYQKHLTNIQEIENDGFIVKRINGNRRKPETKWEECTLISGWSKKAVLNGVFAFIRQSVLEKYASLVQLQENPTFKYRIVDCSGENLPDIAKTREIQAWEICEFCRVCASVGINGIVFDSERQVQEKKFLEWGIKVFKSDSEEISFCDKENFSFIPTTEFLNNSSSFYILGRQSWNKELSEDTLFNEWNTLIKGYSK